MNDTCQGVASSRYPHRGAPYIAGVNIDLAGRAMADAIAGGGSASQAAPYVLRAAAAYAFDDDVESAARATCVAADMTTATADLPTLYAIAGELQTLTYDALSEQQRDASMTFWAVLSIPLAMVGVAYVRAVREAMRTYRSTGRYY